MKNISIFKILKNSKIGIAIKNGKILYVNPGHKNFIESLKKHFPPETFY